jgi:hypothetical protein
MTPDDLCWSRSHARYARAPSCLSPTSCAHDGADASPQVRPRQVVLVSDAMVAMGLPAGTYHFGGDTVEV